MPFSLAANRRIVRASAIYDLLLTPAFATPWTFALAHGQISSLNATLGGAALPAFGKCDRGRNRQAGISLILMADKIT